MVPSWARAAPPVLGVPCPPGHTGLCHDARPSGPRRPARADALGGRAGGSPRALLGFRGLIPTVSLGVTSAVVSSGGHESGHIEPRVTQAWAGHWASHAGPVARPPHRHPPHVQPLAPVRQPHGRRPRLPPRGCTAHTPPSEEGPPWGRLREEQ